MPVDVSHVLKTVLNLWPEAPHPERLSAFAEAIRPMHIDAAQAIGALRDESITRGGKYPRFDRLIARLRDLDRKGRIERSAPPAVKPSGTAEVITDAEYARVMADRADARAWVEALHADDLRELAAGLAEFTAGMVRCVDWPRDRIAASPRTCGLLRAFAAQRARVALGETGAAIEEHYRGVVAALGHQASAGRMAELRRCMGRALAAQWVPADETAARLAAVFGDVEAMA